MRPSLTAPNIRTKKEVVAIGEVFQHLVDMYGFTSLLVIAQSGAFPVVHGVAETRPGFSCLIGASPIGDHLAFFRHINPNTGSVWASRYHDPVAGISLLQSDVFVGITHNPRDEIVPSKSVELYAREARELGRKFSFNFDAKAEDSERHVTLAAAVKMFDENCSEEGQAIVPE